MILRITILASILAASLLPAAIAYAFDGQRKGFVFGFAAGPGYLDFGQDRESTLGVQTDLKLGAGLSDQTIVHYAGKQIWHDDNKIDYTEALPMLALTHYAKPQAPSIFVSGGAGVGFLAEFSDDSGGGDIGPAGFVGGGFEFARHFQVEAGVAATWHDPVTLYNVYLTLGWLGY